MRNEYPIYYLRKGLLGPELYHSHVEKLALTAVIDVYRLRHHILLRKTIVIIESNPMKHILIHHVIGGKYSK